VGSRAGLDDMVILNRKINVALQFFHHRAEYFIQNPIFHYFIEKKRGRMTERRVELTLFMRPVEYVIGFFS
jgi:hypothetical protein